MTVKVEKKRKYPVFIVKNGDPVVLTVLSKKKEANQLSEALAKMECLGLSAAGYASIREDEDLVFELKGNTWWADSVSQGGMQAT